MPETIKTTKQIPLYKRLLLSRIICGKSAAQQIAYIGVITALCIVANFMTVKLATVEFSLTIFFSVLAGMLIGPPLGFCAAFLGDGIGFLINGGGFMYYWWVALSCSTMALISGLVTNFISFRSERGAYIKLTLICALTLAICSVGINSTGMYYLGLKIYMPPNVVKVVESQFGGNLTFGIYLLIRFFILGQIFNSILNYGLLFVALPTLISIKPLTLDFN